MEARLGSAAAAPVMATASVSSALELDGAHVAADALLVAAAAIAVALAIALVVGLRRDRRRLARAAATPASLTTVAAAGVIGMRLTQLGWDTAAGVVLACAVAAWVPLLCAVLRGWERPKGGVGFLVSVATQALAVLCGALHVGWLSIAGVAALAGGLALYAFAAVSFDLGDLRRGRGDQWVAGGALAIAALAAATLAQAEKGRGLGDLLVTVSVALWIVAVAWLPALVAGELLGPRVGFDAQRWSTVFPVGMYAGMSQVVGHAAGAPAIVTAGRAATWIAVLVWAAVAVASARRAGWLLAGGRAARAARS